MSVLSHSASKLSIRSAMLAAAAFAAVGGLAFGPVGAATSGSPYFARWAVSDKDAAFSSKGILYKNIDIAPCGNDFCGVSVGAGGVCGPTLFRFLNKRKNGEDRLKGHGKWGKQVKNVEIDLYRDESLPGGRLLDINLGDGANFAGRDGSMPKYSASYEPVGEAVCKVR